MQPLQVQHGNDLANVVPHGARALVKPAHVIHRSVTPIVETKPKNEASWDTHSEAHHKRQNRCHLSSQPTHRLGCTPSSWYALWRMRCVSSVTISAPCT